MAQTHASGSHSPAFRLLAMVAAGLALYFGREILIPFALAILLSFLLGPVVTHLGQWRIPRIPAVLLAMVFLIAVLCSTGWVVLGQLIQLADKLPQYQQVVHEKLDKLHTRPGSTFDRLNRTFEGYAQEVESITSQPSETQPATPSAPVAATADSPKEIEVRLAKPRTSGLDVLRNVAIRLVEPLATLGLVLILSLFILIQREDIRDRFLRLLGRGRLHVSTKAIDDAAGRVSRYLLMQLAVNSLFGVCTFVGLYTIGVPNSPLWGLLAACMRFMPYFGIPGAAIPPMLLAFVTSPGFGGILMTAALFASLEIVICYCIEPWLYGSRTGISPLAILGSAIFWGWIWGPVGLLLSTPLTVCLAVIGRHIPSLSYLDIIFGDQPALTPDFRFYQRLLAGDHEEATEVAEQYLRENPQVQLFDSLILPVLAMLEEDHQRGRLDDETHQAILGFLGEYVEEVQERVPAPSSANGVVVLCIPASDLADGLAARMLAVDLRLHGAKTTVLADSALIGESLSLIEEMKPDVVCISAVPPHAILHARHVGKRLRVAYPDLKIIVGMWRTTDRKEQIERRLPPTLVNCVVTSIEEALGHIVAVRGAESQPEKVLAATH